jgi:hypothetical protein
VLRWVEKKREKQQVQNRKVTEQMLKDIYVNGGNEYLQAKGTRANVRSLDMRHDGVFLIRYDAPLE